MLVNSVYFKAALTLQCTSELLSSIPIFPDFRCYCYTSREEKVRFRFSKWKT